MLALRPGGSVLTQSARVKLRVSRGARTVLTDDTTLGQLFPGSGLDYRIAWKGQPTKGDYRVKGAIRPKDAEPVFIDEMVTFTPAAVKELKRETPPVASAPAAETGLPVWVWLALAGAAAALIALSVAVIRLKRHTAAPVT